MWTKENIDIRQLNESSGNFGFEEFKVTVNEKETSIIEAIELMKKRLKDENFGELCGESEIQYVYFDRHLYQPLLVEDGGKHPKYKIFPDSLNECEKEFIEDLKEYVRQNRSKFSEHQKMFVLRNIPRMGVGLFVETLNYYPDFVIRLKTDDKQHIIFADPKGLTHMNESFKDEKIQLCSRIKDFEEILAMKLAERGDKRKIVLDPYIISGTLLRYAQPIFNTRSRETFEKHNILFQEEKEKYIGKMLDDKLVG